MWSGKELQPNPAELETNSPQTFSCERVSSSGFEQLILCQPCLQYNLGGVTIVFFFTNKPSSSNLITSNLAICNIYHIFIGQLS